MSKRAITGVVVLAVTAGLVWRLTRGRGATLAAAGLAWWLESPVVDWVAGTRETLAQLDLRPGQQVLEIGPGPGRLLIPAARRVLPGGAVVGVDIAPRMVDRLQARAARAGLTNLTALVGDATALPVAPECFDLVYLCTVLGEIPDRAAALAQCHRAIKPGGRLIITEMRPDPHYLPEETVRELAAAAGFDLSTVQGSWRRYTAIFSRR